MKTIVYLTDGEILEPDRTSRLESGMIECLWSDGEGRLAREAWFPFHAVEMVDITVEESDR
jgi:uncharacterized protein YodC (DUF2158 family)